MERDTEEIIIHLRGIKNPEAVARYKEFVTKYKAVEIERNGNMAALTKAANRLKASNKPQKVLIVPARSMECATTAMIKAGVSGTIRNVSGTRREYVAATAATEPGKSTRTE